MASPPPRPPVHTSPDPATPRTTPMAKYRRAFKSSVVTVSRNGRTNARPTTKLAIDIRIRMTAAKITSPPRIDIPNGRAIAFPSPQIRERRSRPGIFPARSAGHKSRPPVCATPPRPYSSPWRTSAGGHKMIRISRGSPGSRNAQNIKTTAGLGTDEAREETMAREFKLPDIGEGVHEGEVVKWFVKEGDPVKENDPIVEVMTDKVTVQIPSPVTGKILQLRAKEGEVVKVGSTLVVFGEAGEAVPTPPEAARPTAPPPAPARTEAPPAPSPTGDILAAPAVRRLAKELNVNLAAVRGSGPQGRLSEDDVRKVAHGPTRTTVVAPPPAAAVAPSGSEQRIPIHGLRKRIFEKMAKSNVTAAHFTYVEEVDMTQLVHLRDHLKPTADRKGVKLTFLPFFVKAILAALVEFPALNASVDDERGEIVVKGYYNIAIREMMYMSCSFDHRVVDGHVGAAFVQAVRNYLEHPATIFVETG